MFYRLFVCLLLLTGVLSRSKDCTLKSSDGEIYLNFFTRPVESPFVISDLLDNIYYVNVCDDIDHVKFCPDIPDAPAFDFEEVQPGQATCKSMGVLSMMEVPKLLYPDRPLGGVSMKYLNTPGELQTQILFKCEPDVNDVLTGNEMTLTDRDPQYNLLQFSITHRCACPGYSSDCKIVYYPLGKVYGIGGLIITIALVLFVFYLVIGCFVNVVRKKKGVEICPHYHFWMDFPALIKDGVMLPIDQIKRCCLRGSYGQVSDQI